MDATLSPDGARFTLLVERTLDHPVEKVWRAVRERELLKQWFPCDVEGKWVVGAPLRFNFLHGEGEGIPEEDLRGEVMRVDEPRLLEFRWGNHVLKFELAPHATGCRFRLSESFEDSSWGARNAAGWEWCLGNLDLILEGAALAKFAAEVWQARFEHYKAKFEATVGPQAPPSGG